MVEEKGTRQFTLVISQYEKNNTIHYTLRVFSSCEFSLNKIVDPYKKQYEKRVGCALLKIIILLLKLRGIFLARIV